MSISIEAVKLINKNIEGTTIYFSAENVVVELVARTKVFSAGLLARVLIECLEAYLKEGNLTKAKFTAEMIVVVLGNY